MNCHSTRDLLPELLDTRTPATVHTEARAHLATCPDCQRELAALREMLGTLDTMPAPQPSRQLRRNFYAMLAAEKAAAGDTAPTPASRPPLPAQRPTLWRWLAVPFAAAALLTMGFLAGQRATPVAAVDPAAPSAETLALQRQIERLQDKVNAMGTIVSYSLLQQQPANDRLRGVVAESTPDAGQQAINRLFYALALDPNVNVRLSALEGLYAHSEESAVRAGVLASLNREGNPLVQVSMINFLAASRDNEAKPVLEKIFADGGNDQNVREAARVALAQL